MVCDGRSFLNASHVTPDGVYYFNLSLTRILSVEYFSQFLGPVGREFGIGRNINQQNRASYTLNPFFIVSDISCQIIAVNRIQNPDIAIRVSTLYLLLNSGKQIIPGVQTSFCLRIFAFRY
jgi:hypothetical protein